MLISEMKHVGP